jgi:GINS complex subunit 2
MSTQNKALRRFIEEEMKISANELEYLAEYVEVEIVPRFQFNTIKLLQKCNNASGEYGPFMPLRPVIVPLWLALQLKQQRLCSISAPSWMSIAKLEETLENERQSREKNLLSEGILGADFWNDF